MSRGLWNCLMEAPKTEFFQENLVITAAVFITLTLIDYVMGWNWVDGAKSAIASFFVVSILYYVKSVELCYQEKNDVPISRSKIQR